jgi:Leucine-rich repeat (LRR) protein
MSDNYLVELDPMVVQQITELQRLDLKSNKLCTLPYQLGFLSKITTMELSGNPLTAKFRSSELSNPIALLQTLRNRAPKDEQQTKSCAMQVGVPALILGALTKGNTTLDFAGTVSTVDSRAKLQLIVEELKSSSTIAQAITGQLLLDSNYLQSLPGDLLSLLPNLSEVSITRNTLKELPREMLARSPRLRRIQLGRNLLSTDSLGPSLCLFSQNYYTLPAFVSSLTNLDLSANRIESFPANLSSAVFPSLEILNLSSNRIQTVNDWKQLPKSLTFLDLSENSIEDVEPLVYLLASDCPNLQNLSLMHNSLKRIPAILGLLQENCPRVASLNLKGNPQRGIPTHVQDYDCPRLLAYLANRLTPEHRMEAVRNIEERRTSEDIGVECIIVMEDMKEEEITEAGRSHQGEQGQVDQELSSELQRELERNIAQLESQLEYLSLSQAKRYALKKSLAMERSKLIRENRRLQWRK